MILQLINSKGRTVWKSYWDGNYITIEHECGGGCGYVHPESTFLSAFCTLNDNPSCKISGSHHGEFLEYCTEHTSWMCPTLKKRFER